MPPRQSLDAMLAAFDPEVHGGEVMQELAPMVETAASVGEPGSQSSGKQSGAEMEAMAAQGLAGDGWTDETKELAASVLTQVNKQR